MASVPALLVFPPIQTPLIYVSWPRHRAGRLQSDELIYAMVLIGESDGQPASYVCTLPKLNTEPKTKNVRVVLSGGRYILGHVEDFNITL